MVKPKRALLSQISVMYPMELVHLDYLTIEDKESGKMLCFSGNRSIHPLCTSHINILSNSKVHNIEPPR